MAIANTQISADHDGHTFRRYFWSLVLHPIQVQGLKDINITGVNEVLPLNNISNLTVICHKDFLTVTDGI